MIVNQAITDVDVEDQTRVKTENGEEEDGGGVTGPSGQRGTQVHRESVPGRVRPRETDENAGNFGFLGPKGGGGGGRCKGIYC